MMNKEPNARILDGSRLNEILTDFEKQRTTKTALHALLVGHPEFKVLSVTGRTCVETQSDDGQWHVRRPEAHEPVQYYGLYLVLTHNSEHPFEMWVEDLILIDDLMLFGRRLAAAFNVTFTV